MNVLVRRRLAALVIAGVASLLLVCGCSDGPAIRWVSADGHVSTRETAVRAPVGGLVRGPVVREGDRVAPGDAITWLVSPTDGAAVPVLSPARGQIAAPTLTEGELVPAWSTLATVVDVDAPEVVIEVKEADIGEVAVGQPIKVTVDALKLTILTRVASVAIRPIPPSAAPAAGEARYEVRAPLTPVDPRLKAGMSAAARIYTSGGPEVSR